MKKAILAVLVVLLAVLAASCDGAVMPMKASSDPGEVDPAGESFATINIGIVDTSRARAMTLTQAQGAVDYYEVVFYVAGTTPTIVRGIKDMSASGATWGTWTVIVPAVDYDGTTNKVALFAGRESDKTLLAIAEETPNFAGQATGSVTFTLNAIRSGVASTIAASSFLITAPDAPVDYTDMEPITDTSYTGYPVFQIPAEDEITAEYTFTMNAGYFKHAILRDDPTVDVALADDSTATISADISAPAYDSGSPAAIGAGTTAVIAIDIDASGASDGDFNKLSLSIPVYAISAAASDYKSQTNNAVEWIIKGGLNNDDLDTGGNTATGGAVLLKVVDDDDLPESTTATIDEPDFET